MQRAGELTAVAQFHGLSTAADPQHSLSFFEGRLNIWQLAWGIAPFMYAEQAETVCIEEMKRQTAIKYLFFMILWKLSQ